MTQSQRRSTASRSPCRYSGTSSKRPPSWERSSWTPLLEAEALWLQQHSLECASSELRNMLTSGGPRLTVCRAIWRVRQNLTWIQILILLGTALIAPHELVNAIVK